MKKHKSTSTTVVPDSFSKAFDEQYKEQRQKDKEEDDRQRYHFLLLAENQTGYKNLIQLSSLAYTDGFYYKPRVDLEMLKPLTINNNNLIFMYIN